MRGKDDASPATDWGFRALAFAVPHAALGPTQKMFYFSEVWNVFVREIIKEATKYATVYGTVLLYPPSALAALVKEPEDRSTVFREHVEKLGRQVHAFYYCRGKYDGVTIFEVLDELTATAVTLAVSATGHLKELDTTPLHTVEEAMEGMRKAGEQAYKAPQAFREEDLPFSPFGA